MPAGEATAFEVDIARLRLVTFGFRPTGAQTDENFCKNLLLSPNFMIFAK